MQKATQHQPSQGQPWPSAIVARNERYYCLDSGAFRSLVEEGNTHQGSHTVFSLAFSPCKCKAKTALATNAIPEPAHLITLEQSNFGLAALAPDTIQLGLVVRGKVKGQTNILQEPQPGPPDLSGRATYPTASEIEKNQSQLIFSIAFVNSQKKK